MNEWIEKAKGIYNRRHRKSGEEIFRDTIVSYITGSFLKNPNYNSYSYDKYELTKDVKRLAEDLIEDIKGLEHLIIYDESEEDCKKAFKEITDGVEDLMLEEAFLQGCRYSGLLKVEERE
jgi:hypothetical protein